MEFYQQSYFKFKQEIIEFIDDSKGKIANIDRVTRSTMNTINNCHKYLNTLQI